jgi:hypothetical protein
METTNLATCYPQRYIRDGYLMARHADENHLGTEPDHYLYMSVYEAKSHFPELLEGAVWVHG